MILKKYHDTLAVRNYKNSSLKKNIRFATNFMIWCKCPASELKPAVIEDYLIHLYQEGRSPKTIKNHRSGIKVFCDFLSSRGILADNPVRQVPSMELPVEIPVFLTEDEIKKILVMAYREDMVCEITLALYTGLRASELRQLEWRDVDIVNKQLIVRVSKSKKPRAVPLNKKACKALQNQYEQYGNLVYVFPGGIGGYHGRGKWTQPKMRSANWWEKTSVQLIQKEIPSLQNLQRGRTGRGWHALRHTFATQCVKADIDMFKLRDWMGHKKIETTMQYVHIARNYDSDIELL